MACDDALHQAANLLADRKDAVGTPAMEREAIYSGEVPNIGDDTVRLIYAGLGFGLDCAMDGATLVGRGAAAKLMLLISAMDGDDGDVFEAIVGAIAGAWLDGIAIGTAAVALREGRQPGAGT